MYTYARCSILFALSNVGPFPYGGSTLQLLKFLKIRIFESTEVNQLLNHVYIREESAEARHLSVGDQFSRRTHIEDRETRNRRYATLTLSYLVTPRSKNESYLVEIVL